MKAKKTEAETAETKMIPIEDLELNRGQIAGLPKNPRFIRDDRFEALKKSIEDNPEMMNLRELLVYPFNGKFVVIGGNMRLRACTELGFDEVPCKVIPFETPVEALRAYTVKDNVGFGENDWDAFANDWDLSELKAFGLTFDDVPGFDDEEESADSAEDDFDSDNVKARCKKGEVWQLGNHRLMCGDSTDAQCVERLMGGEKAALLLTDPPYGVNIVQNATDGGDKPFGTLRSDKGAPVSFKGTPSRPKSREIVPATKKYVPIKGDESTETARKSYEIAKDVSETQIIFGGNYFTDFLPPSRCWIVWEKGVPEGAFFAPVELAWVNKDANAKLYKVLWSGLCREGDRDIEGVKRVHPTQKPVSLCARILDDFTKDGDNVLDLFGGSGSTLIACEQTNRKCFMMEFEEYYCDVIISRWEQLTGRTAEKVNA